MTATAWTLRALWTVSPHHLQVIVVNAAVALFGIWTVVTLPRDIGAPYVLLLFCQLFGASSGFRPAADAGHYDAILVGGSSRRRLALTHWSLSVAPGIAAWAIVSIAELWCLEAGQAVGTKLPSLAAVLLVSTCPWAASLATARFFGGAVWLLIMGLIATSSHGFAWMREVVGPSAPDGLVENGLMLTRFVAVPFMYLVPPAFDIANGVPVLLGTAVLSAAALAGGVAWIVRRDFTGSS